MSIHREQLEEIDFTDVAEGTDLLPAVPPGEILREDFMKPLGLSANALAKALHVPTNRITAILNGSRSITADTALRLARYFNTTPTSWLNLQKNYELESRKTQGCRDYPGQGAATGRLTQTA
ncbi:HigA family addiction module antidote protein [Thiorhodococcus mannitoliphagus]|uniref:HigA family addiction module antidote protein n=1 Tax=Thiorhodococcus mannitoliphagus TaxID=329406 RepID=A0A6P1DNZ1_9GAMM|nr:HigA family addiction module antitoxin [Thiorhodococcus mannitoliphagus]NEX19718.1 HigA family addiction module antidote protein [Thiorhodococcus mannitoliphagus]